MRRALWLVISAITLVVVTATITWWLAGRDSTEANGSRPSTADPTPPAVGTAPTTISPGSATSATMHAPSAISGSPTAVPVDPRELDWDTATIPLDWCGVVGETVQLQDATNDQVVLPDADFGPGAVRLDDVLVGDATGDGTWEALLRVSCDNNSGTAAGLLHMAVLVADVSTGSADYIGQLPAQHPDPEGSATLISQVIAEDGTVLMSEAYYRGDDGTCCPSGHLVSRWVWDGNGFTLDLG